MYKVLIIDDEYYIRQRLITCIEWEEEGFEIAGEASNAEEALSVLENGGIDMAVVDISMPQKDGLTLIQELREKNLAVKIIILSGYGTFAYAQKAIGYGVTQYLLKPIDEDDLIKSLRQIKKALDSERAIRNIRQTKHRTDHQLSTIRKENYFKKIFTTHPLFTQDRPVLEPQMKDYGMMEGAACRILVFDFKSRHLQSLDLKDLQLFRYAANNILCELSQPLFRAIDASDIFSHGVLICECPDQEDPQLLPYLEQSVKKVKELLGLDICFGCSAVFPLSLHGLNKEYQRALASYVLCNIRGVDYVMSQAANQVISQAPALAKEPVTQNLYGINQAMARIEACFCAGQETELCRSLAVFFDLLEQDPLPFFYLEQKLSRLVMLCTGKAAEHSGRQPLTDDLSFALGYKELLFAGYDLNYLRQKIQALFLSMTAAQDISVAGSAKEALVEEAVKFIDAHYSRCDMSLTLLSQNLLISPAYLSSIFKKIKGISINQYLTQSRLDKARELLSGTSLTLTEIAERVGYNDLFYFSKVFKRYFGVAPSAYKPPAH